MLHLRHPDFQGFSGATIRLQYPSRMATPESFTPSAGLPRPLSCRLHFVIAVTNILPLALYVKEALQILTSYSMMIWYLSTFFVFFEREDTQMKKAFKRIAVLAMAIAVVFAFTACGDSNVTGTKDDPLIAAMEPTFPPFDTTKGDKDDKDSSNLTGFDVDLVNAIAKDQDLVIEWKNMEFDGLIPALDSGNIDIVASGVTITKARKKKVDFSDSYYDSGLSLAVAKSNSSVNGLDDLTKDMIVGAQIGTSGAKKAEQLKKDGKIKDVKTYNGLDVTFNDLANGTVDAVINDKPVTENYIEKQPDKIKIVGKTINAESYGIAVKKGNTELLDKINEGLKNVKEDGTYDKLYKKWKLGSE